MKSNVESTLDNLFPIYSVSVIIIICIVYIYRHYPGVEAVIRCVTDPNKHIM